jgi:hypothetical protein
MEEEVSAAIDSIPTSSNLKTVRENAIYIRLASDLQSLISSSPAKQASKNESDEDVQLNSYV